MSEKLLTNLEFEHITRKSIDSITDEDVQRLISDHRRLSEAIRVLNQLRTCPCCGNDHRDHKVGCIVLEVQK